MTHRANKTQPPFASAGPGDYLLAMLMEVGPVKATDAGGMIPIKATDLLDHATLMDWQLDSEEAGLILNMSRAFSQGMSEGESPFSIAPVDRVDDD